MKIKLPTYEKDSSDKILKCYALDSIILILPSAIQRQVQILHYYDSDDQKIKADLVKISLEKIQTEVNKLSNTDLWRSHRENMMNLKYVIALNETKRVFYLKGELTAKIAKNNLTEAKMRMCTI